MLCHGDSPASSTYLEHQQATLDLRENCNAHLIALWSLDPPALVNGYKATNTRPIIITGLENSQQRLAF